MYNKNKIFYKFCCVFLIFAFAFLTFSCSLDSLVNVINGLSSTGGNVFFGDEAGKTATKEITSGFEKMYGDFDSKVQGAAVDRKDIYFNHARHASYAPAIGCGLCALLCIWHKTG